MNALLFLEKHSHIYFFALFFMHPSRGFVAPHPAFERGRGIFVVPHLLDLGARATLLEDRLADSARSGRLRLVRGLGQVWLLVSLFLGLAVLQLEVP